MLSKTYSAVASAFVFLAALGVPAGAQDSEPDRYFDIRLTEDKAAFEKLEQLRQEKGSTPEQFADAAQLMSDAQARLAGRVPGFDVIQSRELLAPEIVGVAQGFARLTGLSDEPTETIARQFVEAHSGLYGLSIAEAQQLEIDADYTNPAGNISWVRLKQRVNGLPVFRGELTIAMTNRREIFRTMGQISGVAPGVSPPLPKLSPAEAVATGAAAIGLDVDPETLALAEKADDDTWAILEPGPLTDKTKVELIYFPLGKGAVELAWSMTLWGEPSAYYTIVSANDGLLLFNKNITEDQTQSATFEVYRNVNAFMDVADSPAPLSLGPVDPGAGTQGSLLSRENVTLIGNEGPLFFNDNGWITDGANGTDGWTDGNNVEAGLDIDGTNGVDAPVSGTGLVFSSAWNPPPGNPGPGDVPSVQAARDGAVIEMFYTVNRYHDALYQLGFTEAAFNFQDDNFGRGGVGGDRISAEGQDSSSTNNANFSTPADGGRGQMQMFVFTGPDPDRDGTIDNDIVIHELTHGTSNRLHGNASGLGTNMARAMGEGWSDFYAHALLSELTDPINGTYSTGGYVLLDGFGAIGTTNYYYGIRRFPKAVMSFTGGPMNRPHNPLTFADLNVGCDVTDGAFPPASGPHISGTCDQVHAAGEIWSSMLWEVRALMVQRLGFAAGNERALQVVTDGMKLSPVDPTFVHARDAIIAAASVFGSADVVDVREGFRIRGLGFSAEVVSVGQPAVVVEAFDFPNVVLAPPVTWQNLSCADPSRNPIPGETVAISVPVTNATGSTITNVVATVAGNGVSYGSIADGQTVAKDVLYTIGATEICGTELMFDVDLMSDAGMQAPGAFALPVGEATTTTTSFENTTPIDIPMGQPGTTSGPANPYPSTVSVSGITAPVDGITVTLNSLSHTWVDDVDVLLEGPGGQTMIVLSDGFGNTDAVPTTVVLSDTAPNEVPNSGPLASGDYLPTNHESGDSFDAPAPVGPYGDPGPSGTATFASVFGGAAANGDWKLWIDDDADVDSGTMEGGWTLGIITSQPPICLPCTTLFCTPVLDVSDQVIGGALQVNACEALTAGDFVILGPDGDTVFRAGESIELLDGFRVETEGEFEAVIDPSLLPF